jgi:hypothetical protein
MRTIYLKTFIHVSFILGEELLTFEIDCFPYLLGILSERFEDGLGT